MTYRVLLAAADPGAQARLRAAAQAAGEFTVAAVVPSRPELLAAMGGARPDVVVLHEDLGLPAVLELARYLSAGLPEVGVVLLVREQSPATLSEALHAGIRGVAGLPLDAHEVRRAVRAAGDWARTLRPRLAGRSARSASGLGTVVGLAGAKGGVGTTTLAVHLALVALQAGGGRSVCLVDFDVEAGDVRSLLDLPPRRDLGRLVGIPGSRAGHEIDDQLTLHPTGLRVLLAPPTGLAAHDVPARLGRDLLGHLRTRFDLVVVDTGSRLGPLNSTALAMADRSVLVMTPDTLALRATARLLERWRQADVHPGGLHLLVNRQAADADVTPELIEQVVTVPRLQTSVPADFPALAAATNTGAAERLEDGPLRRGVAQLADELGLLPQKRRSRTVARKAEPEPPVTPLPLPDTAPLRVMPRAAAPH